MKNDEFRMQRGEILNAINSAHLEGRPPICHFLKRTKIGRTRMRRIYCRFGYKNLHSLISNGNRQSLQPSIYNFLLHLILFNDMNENDCLSECLYLWTLNINFMLGHSFYIFLDFYCRRFHSLLSFPNEWTASERTHVMELKGKGVKLFKSFFYSWNRTDKESEKLRDLFEN